MAGAILTAMVATGCGIGGSPAASPITDANALITQSVLSLQTVKSIHVEVTMAGSVNASALGAGGIGSSGSIKLDGTTVSGDVDVKGQAYHMTLSMPTMLGLTAEIIQVDGSTYTRMSLTGDKYSKASAANLGVVAASVGPSGSPDFSKEVDDLKTSLEGAGAKATIEGSDTVAGRDSYHASISLPMATINNLIATQGGTTLAGVTVDSASFEYWVYKDTVQPAKIEIKGTSAKLGNIDLVLTLTKYDAVVTITAPPAGQVQTAP
jgi:hypothetical protein